MSEVNSLPIVKVYDIDYSFIIKNYLDPSLWCKEWLLFCYKNFKVYISLSSIYCSEGKISFKIKVVDGNNEDSYVSNGIFYDNSEYSWTYYHIDSESIDVLKKSIISTASSIINSLEEKLIRLEDGYIDILDVIKQKKELLTEIAEEFLDNNNVTNSDIREAYIDWYLDKMEDNNTLKTDYINSRKYNVLTDVWYVWAQATKNEELLSRIVTNCSTDKIAQVKEDYEEYRNYLETEDFKCEAIDELEDI